MRLWGHGDDACASATWSEPPGIHSSTSMIDGRHTEPTMRTMLACCSCEKPTCTITRAQVAHEQVTRFDAAVRQALAPLAPPRPTHSPLRGRADAIGGRALYTAPPGPPPPDSSAAKSLLACQGSTGAGEERGTGGSDQSEPPQG